MCKAKNLIKYKKRLLAMLLSLAVLLSAVPNIVLAAETDPILDLSVNFQNDDIDAITSDDWVHVPVGTTKSADGTVKVVADPAEPDSSNKVLLVSGKAAGVSVPFEEQNGKVTAEFRILFDSYDVYTVRFRYGVETNTMQAVSFIARATGSLEYNNGSTAVKFISGEGDDKYEINKWYDVKIDADIANGEYDIYVDGIKVNGGTKAKFANGTGGAKITVLNALSYNNTGATTGNMYVDDVHIYQDGVSMPQASVPGGSYTSPQEVELFTATKDAAIFYTLDGTEPSSESTEYTGAILVSESMTIKAIAIKESAMSSVMTEVYNIVEESEPTPVSFFDFEDDPVGQMPKYPWSDAGTAKGVVSVQKDPDDPTNNVLFIEDTNAETNAIASLAMIEQTGNFTVKFRVRYEALDVYTIVLKQGDDNTALGVSLVARKTGKLSVYNGTTETQLMDYETGTWYDVEINVDAMNNRFNLSIDGDEKIANASFRSAGVTAIDRFTLGTTGATIGNLYVDDVEAPLAPERAQVQIYMPGYKEYQVLYDAEADEDLAKPGQTYTSFPSIIRMDDEHIFITYKHGYAHMNDDGDVEAIIYNTVTESVYNRFVIDDEVTENAQNPEVLRMPNGDLVIYCDIQRTTSTGRQRLKVNEYRSTDNGYSWNLVRESLKDNTGIEYGYTFDDVIIGDRIYMLAMSFPEFNNELASPGRSVHMIYSDDNGETWTHLKNLNEEFGYAFNESTFESYEDGFVVFTRGDAQSTRIYKTDINLNVIESQILTGNVDTVFASGRPKLFIKDGDYYVLMRGYPYGSGNMNLVLHKINMETLIPENCIILDETPGDGFYAEHYFQTKDGVEYFNAITYTASYTAGSKPDIVRLEYIWDEISNPDTIEAVSAPEASLPGGTYTEAITVSLSTETQFATIYYTIDGTNPTTGSNKYTGPLAVNSDMTIKAIAVRNGIKSEVMTESYVIDIAEQVKTPKASVLPGSYTEVQTVELTTETDGAVIYYTTDGSTPDAESTRYEEPIMVNTSMTIKAIAVKSGMISSSVASFNYVIDIEPEIPDDGIFYDFEDETIGSMPGYPWFEVGTELGVVTVQADPEDSGNKVLYINDPSTKNSIAAILFEDQTGIFKVKFKVRYSNFDVYTVTLREGTDTSKLAMSFIARGNGKLSVYNGSTETVLMDYETDTWYDVEVIADVVNQRFSLAINGETKISKASFRHSGITAINYLALGSAGATIGDMYVDDVMVPRSPEEPPVVQVYTPEYKELQILYDADTDTELSKPGQTYASFPTILEIDNDELLIIYKHGFAHANDDGDMEAVIYDKVSETVISRFVIDDEDSENTQNPEVLRMPNGDLVIYCDIQRTTPSGRQRLKVKEYRSTDNGRTWTVVSESLKDNTGIEYGYTFDDVIIGDRIYMLAMSFPEFNNDQASPGRSVHMIYSDDNGETWIHLKNLNEEFGYAFNESTFEPYEDGFAVFTRGDSQSTRIYITDMNLNVLRSKVLTGNVQTITSSGRPKMFIKDGEYYVLMRGVPSGSGPMNLVLHRFDMETLLPENCVILDVLQTGSGRTSDGYYAEQYFTMKDGVEYLNVITYSGSYSAKPDIVRLEYIWKEIKEMKPVDFNPPVWNEDSLTVEKINDNQAELKWTAASDDRGVKSYEVYQNNEVIGKIDFSETEEFVFNLPGAKVNYENQGQVYLVMPKNVPENVKLPMVIGVHGSGGNAFVFRDHAMYSKERDMALKYGYIFVALSNGQDAWGTDDGLYNLNLLYEYMMENYNVDEKAVLYAYSAGGTLAYRMIREYPEKVDFMIGTYPVYDMTSFTGASAQNAWGCASYAEYVEAVADVNPSNYPEALKNHSIYLSHGSVDAAVPVEANSLKLKNDVTALGGYVELQIVEGKGHDSSVEEYYTETANNAFIENPAEYVMVLDSISSEEEYSYIVVASDGENMTDSNTVIIEAVPGGGDDDDDDDDNTGGGDDDDDDDDNAGGDDDDDNTGGGDDDDDDDDNAGGDDDDDNTGGDDGDDDDDDNAGGDDGDDDDDDNTGGDDGDDDDDDNTEQPAVIEWISENSFTVEVDSEDTDATVKISVNVEGLKPSSIAVIVYPDGREEIIKKSSIEGENMLLILPGSATVKIIENNRQYSDINPDEWYREAVEFVSARELMKGTSETEFNPYYPANRAMIVTILHRLENSGSSSGENHFVDIPDGSWYADSVAWAVENGITFGYGDGRFGPDDTVTREQLIVFLYRYMKVIGVSAEERDALVDFNDSGEISSWAQEAMEWAVGAGIINGKGDGTLDPAGVATRAEVAAMMQRVIDYIIK